MILSKNSLQIFFLNRTKKEQIYILILIFFLTFFLWLRFIFMPLTHEKRITFQKYQNTLLQTQELESKTALFGTGKMTLSAEYENLKKQNALLEKKIKNFAFARVEHRQIAALLRTLIEEEGQMQLTDLQSYHHSQQALNEEGATLTFLGDFRATHAFLHRMKNSQFAWHIEELSYQVEKFPLAKITLTLSVLTQ